MHNWLLIGIKDGKWTVLVQTGEPESRSSPMLHYAAKKIKKQLGDKAFDKYIAVPGFILNI